jgi:hypothetical protein
LAELDTEKADATATTTALAAKAPLASPALTGTPTAPTAAQGTNTTQVATTAFTRAEIAALVNSAPSTLDTLGEIATALTADESTAAALATTVGTKAPIASPTFTGTPAAPTPAASDNSTKIATTAYVDAADALAVPKALVDAKGDLLVGTADNTVARKAVGSDGQVLTADSTQAGGVKWAAAAGLPTGGAQGAALVKNSATDGDASFITPPWAGGDYFRSGRYYLGAPMHAALTTDSTFGLNVLMYRPFFLPVRRAFDRLGLNISSAAAGGSGAVIRMGIYTNTGGLPDALVVASSTISVETTGSKELTIANTLDPGLYWLCAVPQVVLSTLTWRGFASTWFPAAVDVGTTPPSSLPAGGFYTTGVSGALPSTAAAPTGTVSAGGILPAVCLRAA